MEMAGIVTYTGAMLIKQARELVEQVCVRVSCVYLIQCEILESKHHPAMVHVRSQPRFGSYAVYDIRVSFKGFR